MGNSLAPFNLCLLCIYAQRKHTTPSHKAQSNRFASLILVFLFPFLFGCDSAAKIWDRSLAAHVHSARRLLPRHRRYLIQIARGARFKSRAAQADCNRAFSMRMARAFIGPKSLRATRLVVRCRGWQRRSPSTT